MSSASIQSIVAQLEERHPPSGADERYLYFYRVAYGLGAACLRYAKVYGERQNPHASPVSL